MKLIAIIGCVIACFSHVIHADTSQLERNKQLVTEFYTQALFYGDASAVDKYIGEHYIQHNPNVADGKTALRNLIDSFPLRSVSDGPTGEIVRVIAEGDLVVLHVRNFNWPGPHGGAIVDIFRVEDNKIVEHWDVIQAIPAKSKNTNTMF